MNAEPLGKLRRTHRCHELRTEHDGQTVTLMGWVHRRRDLGGLIFLDLRDRYGITQCVLSPTNAPEAFAKAEKVRSEFVLACIGQVKVRAANTVNKNIETGEVELHVDQLVLLNTSRPLPMPVAEEGTVDESLRMQYRYLDIRRPAMTRNLVIRHKMAKAIRDYLDSQNFCEIETPMLVSSTPEGARDYLVPSRVHGGKFYALPQSPQIFKQLLMVSGMDRYFQIARCFRDEDLRADRQPEFTQIDMEMTFVGQEDVFAVVEGMLKHVFATVHDYAVPTPFRQMPWREAMERYGSDKPDLRYELDFHDITEVAAASEFAAFKNGTPVKAFKVSGQGALSRKDQDEWVNQARGHGLGGLMFASRLDGGYKSSILKHFGEERMGQVFSQLGAGDGDLVVLATGEQPKLNLSLGKLRIEMAKKFGLIAKDRYEFLWVVDFPLFAWNEDEKRLEPEHHPFTSCHPDDLHMLDAEPVKCRAAAYDLVLNGNEAASGSIRIHEREMQERVLGCVGLTIDDARAKFGFLLDAFEFGAPPHGGIALGFDRLCAICAGYESIREVIAFPKNANAADPLTGAPVEVSREQLDILSLDIRKKA